MTNDHTVPFQELGAPVNSRVRKCRRFCEETATFVSNCTTAQADILHLALKKKCIAGPCYIHPRRCTSWQEVDGPSFVLGRDTK